MMSNSRQRRTVHSHVISAPPQAVYDLVPDVTRWPAIFPPTLHIFPPELPEHAEALLHYAIGPPDPLYRLARKPHERPSDVRFIGVF